MKSSERISHYLVNARSFAADAKEMEETPTPRRLEVQNLNYICSLLKQSVRLYEMYIEESIENEIIDRDSFLMEMEEKRMEFINDLFMKKKFFYEKNAPVVNAGK